MDPTSSTVASVIVLTGLLYLVIFRVALFAAAEQRRKEADDAW